MRTGYSILLGEFVDAAAIAYRDCEPFQIVCPACHEPVFKVEREAGESSTKYLSHYRQSASFDADCELRASRVSVARQVKHNTIARNQKLSYFLLVFTSLLEGDPFQSYDRGVVTARKTLARSKAWRFFRDQHRKASRASESWKYDDFAEFAAFYVKEGFANEQIPCAGFSGATQTRIASDMMQLLLTEPARQSYEDLFNHAALYVLARYGRRPVEEAPESSDVSSNLTRFISRLMRSGAREGMATLDEMSQTYVYPPFVLEPSSYVLKVASEIGHEMVGTLLRLPYFAALKNSGSPPPPAVG